MHRIEFTTTRFSATFGVKWRTTVCANNGADANIIDNKALQKFNEAGVEL